MSKELEERVKKLLVLEERKRAVAKENYAARRDFDREYTDVLALVKSGHTLPEGSPYYARIAITETGRANYKYVLDAFTESHPQYANTIRKLLEESKHQRVERLEYGLARRES